MRDENQLALAQKELLKIEQYKAPRDKLVCILNACKGGGEDDVGTPLAPYANLHLRVSLRGPPQS